MTQAKPFRPLDKAIMNDYCFFFVLLFSLLFICCQMCFWHENIQIFKHSLNELKKYQRMKTRQPNTPTQTKIIFLKFREVFRGCKITEHKNKTVGIFDDFRCFLKPLNTCTRKISVVKIASGNVRGRKKLFK